MEVMATMGMEEISKLRLEMQMVMALRETSASRKERGHQGWPETQGNQRSENKKSMMLRTYLHDRGASTACKGEEGPLSQAAGEHK